jgi:UDP:flavonoid glycosyltransferase YjiC (YdhE family)
MSRIVLAWELGSNLGHLSRLLPLARRLQGLGHSPVIMTRDVLAAARVLRRSDIPFIQAPLALVAGANAAPVSYAELIWRHGWAEPLHLWGLVQSWACAFRMLEPSVVVLDHAPTAALAARIANIGRVLIGTGFEIPPRESPLPPFPLLETANKQQAVHLERMVLRNVNTVLGELDAPALQALHELFDVDACFLTTFAELDHYGARDGAHYVGPIGQVDDGEVVEWPPGSTGQHAFAYLRPEIAGAREVLRALANRGVSVVCYMPGASSAYIESLRVPQIHLASRPVKLEQIFEQTDLCVSYAPAGTVTSFLLEGIPQLMLPQHLEAQLTASRVEQLGAGLTIRDPTSEAAIARDIERVLCESQFKARAGDFAARHRGVDATVAVALIADRIAEIAAAR